MENKYRKIIILLSDRSKKSVKDAIRIRVPDIDRVVGKHCVYNASRVVLLIYLSILLDPTKSVLDMETTIDDHWLLNANASEFPLEYEMVANEPTHIFNSYDTSGAMLLFVEQPEKSFSFRITNGGLWSLWIKDANEESLINYIFTGHPAAQQQICVGSTWFSLASNQTFFSFCVTVPIL